MTTLPTWLFWIMALGDALAFINIGCWIYLTAKYLIDQRRRP